MARALVTKLRIPDTAAQTRKSPVARSGRASSEPRQTPPWYRAPISTRAPTVLVMNGPGRLYRVPEIVTRGRFPDGGESDSTWRTQEARHVGSDTIAPGF